jgi:hypothetical protein
MRKIFSTYDVDNEQLKNLLGEVMAGPPKLGLREQVLLCLTLVYADGTAVAFGAADTFTAAVDTDFDDSTALMVYTINAGINAVGDWGVADPELGKLSIRLDCNTATFKNKIGTTPVLPAYFELQSHDAGDPALAFKIKFDVTCTNLVDDNAALPDPSPAIDYYTAAQIDAMLPSYALKVGTSDIEITDATKGVILRTAGGDRVRITVVDTGAGVMAMSLTTL